MSKLRLEKVIGDVPGTLAPDCVYAVRAGAGYDLRVSDITGSVAHKLNLDTEQLLDLPEAAATLLDYVIVVQGGVVKKITPANFRTAIQIDPQGDTPANAVYYDGEPVYYASNFVLYGD